MATVYGLLGAFESDDPPNQVAANVLGGRIRVMYEEFTVVAATAQDDDLVIGFLPATGRFLLGWVWLSATLGASTTLDVGSRDRADITLNVDDDRFASALDGTVTTLQEFDEAGGFGYSPTNEQEIILAFEGADPAAAVVVKTLVLYVDSS